MYRLTIEITNEPQETPIGVTPEVAPSRTVIEFDLPAGGTEANAKAIARGIRKAFRDVFEARVKVVSFQQTGLVVDVDLPAN